MASVSVVGNGSGSTVAGASPIHAAHAVSRSNELLSCAKTALKIVKANNAALAPDSASYNPMVQELSVESLQLQDTSFAPAHSATVMAILEDGLTLLRAMEFGLKQLHGLVRRRGHTNDPTMEISVLVQQLEQDYKELEEFCQQLVQRASGSSSRRPSKQALKHWQHVATWFQEVASHQSVQLKEVLKLRGTVLADQAQRRKQVQQQQQQKQDPQNNQSTTTSTNGTTNPTTPAGRKTASSSSRRPMVTASATATPLFDSPLFTATQKRQGGAGNHSNGTTTGASRPLYDYQSAASPALAAKAATGNGPSNGGSTQTSYYSSSGYGGGGGGGAATSAYGYGGDGYYGGSGQTNVQAFGMRQRKAGSSTEQEPHQQQYQQADEPKVHSHDASTYVQQQIQEREVKRQTAQRVAEARQAERTLGELGSLFGKMSTLISQQGEVLEKVEDDVEAALADVTAGQEELTTTLSLKKGNRPLIIKTFLILNFFICFMKLYKK